MTTTAEPLADAGSCTDCGCGQWQHRLGKKGCKDPECGCGGYVPPKDAPAPEPQPVDEPAAEPEPHVAPLPGAVPVTEEEIRDLLVGRAEAAERERDRYRGLATDRLIERDQAQAEAKDAAHAATNARRALADLRREVTQREEQIARERGALAAEIARLREELDRANLARQRAQDAIDQAVHTGLTAAARVLWRYDADQCRDCGFRTTVPGLNHTHPMTPVTVLVVERDQTEATATATDTTKEQ